MRNNRKLKPLLVLVLCVSLILGTVSIASAETFDTTELITGTNVTVTAAQTNAAVSDAAGLKIVTQTVGATAQIEGLFAGDFELEWSAKGGAGDQSNQYVKKFTFRFEDVEDSSNYFDWVLMTNTASGGWGSWYTCGYILFDGQPSFYSKNVTDGTLYYDMATFTSQGQVFGMQNGYFADNSGTRTKGWFKWDNTNKKFYSNFQSTTLCAFDAADMLAKTGKEFKGFSDSGYVVKMIFDDIKASVDANVFIHSIKDGATTLDLSGETLASTPACYTALDDYLNATIAITPASKLGLSEKGVEITVPAATYVYGANNGNCYKTEIIAPDTTATDVTSTMKYTPAAAGTYTVKYTAIDGNERKDNVYTYTFNVVEFFDSTDLLDGAEIAANTLFNGVSSVQVKGVATVVDGVSGLHIEGGAGTSATLNKVFTGKNDFSFSFDFSKYIKQFTVRFTDVNDQTNYVDYVLYKFGSGSWDTLAYASYSKDANAYCYIHSGVCSAYEDKSKFVFGTSDWGQSGIQFAYLWQWADQGKKFLPNVSFDPANGKVASVKVDGPQETTVYQGGNTYKLAPAGAYTSGDEVIAPAITGFADGYTVTFTIDKLDSGATGGFYLHYINDESVCGEKTTVEAEDFTPSVETYEGVFEQELAFKDDEHAVANVFFASVNVGVYKDVKPTEFGMIFKFTSDNTYTKTFAITDATKITDDGKFGVALYNLPDGDYEVTAYAIIGGKTITGNTVELTVPVVE